MKSPPMQTGMTAAQTQAQAAQQAIAVNNAVRAGILNSAIEVKQEIFSQTISNPGSTNNTVQVKFQPVGLVKGFIVVVDATISEIHAGDSAIIASPWAAANLLSQVTLVDLDNYQRINTTGWHLNMLATAKEGFPHGAALQGNWASNAYGSPVTGFDEPVQYGANFPVFRFVAPTSGATGRVRMYYWVPCAYSASDLRGSIFAGVVNATAYLQMVINPTPWVAQGSDATTAVFTSGGATAVTPPTISSAQITVYQVYLDQLPRYQSGPQAGAPILPPLDIATQYRLNNTSLSGISIGQDFPVPFSNFQQFLSLGLIYDQAGTLNAGSDVNYFALAAANTYLPFKVDPLTQAWITRHKMKTDLPLGSYMFDFRGQPISTNQTGNMQLFLNASSAAVGSQVMAAFESFALVNTVLGAASLPAS